MTPIQVGKGSFTPPSHRAVRAPHGSHGSSSSITNVAKGYECSNLRCGNNPDGNLSVQSSFSACFCICGAMQGYAVITLFSRWLKP